MGWLTALTGIMSPALGLANTWIERRGQVAVAKHEARLERIKAMEGDWKDEWLIVIWSYPFVSMFVPITAVQQATFAALDRIGILPEWYLGGWVAISLAIFGVDKITKVKR